MLIEGLLCAMPHRGRDDPDRKLHHPREAAELETDFYSPGWQVLMLRRIFRQCLGITEEREAKLEGGGGGNLSDAKFGKLLNLSYFNFPSHTQNFH